MELNLDGIQIQKRKITAATLLQVMDTSEELTGFTEKFGSSTLARFRKECLFTTKTETLEITTLQTLKCLLQRNTFRFTKSAETGIRKMLAALLDWTKLGRQHQGGTVAKLAWNGIRSMGQSTDLQTGLRQSSSAFAAESGLSLLFQMQSAVLSNARKIDTGSFRRTKLNCNATSADADLTALRSRRGVIQNRQSFAEINADSNGCSAKGLPVFNLKVKDCPEFFANGILVHNCDAAAGALEALRVPTGAWSGNDIQVATTGYQRPAGEAIDVYDNMVDATEGEL
jgi:hypothetical protein